MKFLFIMCLFLYTTNTFAQINETTETVTYDSLLAKELGADEYGMKKFVMAFLKAGNVKIDDPEKRAEIQKGHMQNIVRLADEGKLILAGPFIDNKEIRGIFLFDVETIEEARELTESDPAIQAGTLSMELYNWYGSAALKLIYNLSKKIQKQSIIN